jgi:oxygen-independent coproporphyrinogen-3 oxidase
MRRTMFPVARPDLVSRLDVPGPRYTSYPTVADWSEAFGEGAFEAKLDEAGRADPSEPLSLYVHIPFCRKRCTFCGCNVVIAHDPSRADRYLDDVALEMDLVTRHLGRRRALSQIHWGGGTPTFLDEGQLARLYGEITSRFSVLEDAEVAIELDPAQTTRAQLGLLRELGFNRLSMGVQDFDRTVQQAINRDQTVDETMVLVDHARAIGFTSISFDLIYGLPHQTPESWRRSLADVIALRPDRAAVYSFAFVPDVRPHQKRLPIASLPRGTEKLELFKIAFDAFGGAGYVQIGMDHFARPEDELARARFDGRSFQGYTVKHASDVIAFGASAISDVRGAYAQNVQALPQYHARVAAGRLAVEKGVLLDADDRRRRDLIRELMCNFRVELGDDGERYFARELEALRGLETDGLVERRGTAVSLTELGQVFVRNVAMVFDARLAAHAGRERFSRAV